MTSNLFEKDLTARTEALNPSESFIVQAPAGSGKTELLTQRYLKLLGQTVQAPEEIIAITFTRKAAAEMRSRIVQALENAEREPEPEQPHKKLTWQLAKTVLTQSQQHQWHLLQNPNRLRIFTIDSLAAKLSAQIPLLAMSGIQPNISDNPKPLYQQAAQELLTSLPTHPLWEEALETLLLHLDNRVYQVETLLMHILSKREQWLPHILGIRAEKEALKNALEAGLRYIALEAIQTAKTHLDSFLPELMPLTEYALKNLHQEPLPDPLTQTLDDLTHWQTLADMLLTKSGEWRRRLTKDNGFPTPSSFKNKIDKAQSQAAKDKMQAIINELQQHEKCGHALTALQQCPPQQYSDSQWQLVAALTELLPILVAHLNLTFQEQNTIDFVELNLGALRSLGEPDNPTDLALYLDYQIKHLLIDEFQDTSITQYELIQRLISGWENQDGRTLFLVGDPMQSVYRFRNAEVGLFLRAQQQGLGAVALQPLTLTLNFRSQANLVDWFNQTFVTVFPDFSDITSGAVPFSPALAALPATTKAANLYPLINADTIAEATLIVKIIQQHREQQPTSSIAILVRSRSQLESITPALREAELPFQAIAIESLFDCSEIQDLMTLTKALLHQADGTSWLALLRAPWCGLALHDLHAIAEAAGSWPLWHCLKNPENIPHLSTDGLIRLKRLVIPIKAAYQEQGRMPLATWLKNIWKNISGPTYLQHENQLRNAETFFKLIDALEQEFHSIPLDQLNDKLHQIYADPEMQSPEAIQIMTVHKSKGLEFDHVIIPDLQRKTPVDANQLLQWLERPNLFGGSDLILAPIKSSSEHEDALYTYCRQVESEKLHFEMARLLYVAATRAKQSLHLLACVTPQEDDPTQWIKPSDNTFLRLLWEPFLQATPIHYTPLTSKTEVKPTRVLQRLPLDWHTPTPITLKQEKNLSRQFKIEPEQNPSRHVGTLIHEILADIATKNLTLEETLKRQHQWRQHLSEVGFITDMETHLDVVRQCIIDTLQDPRGQWILSTAHQDAHCEWPLSMAKDNQTLHLIIDRSFVDEHGTRWIIDYKTAIPHTEAANHFLQKQKQLYQPQLEQYADALKQWDDKPIKLGLYFPRCQLWTEWDAVMNTVEIYP